MFLQVFVFTICHVLQHYFNSTFQRTNSVFLASWMTRVSLDILETAWPVVNSVSKNAMSCLRTAFKYKERIRADCLSPAIVQHDTSGTSEKLSLLIQLYKQK